MSLVLLAVLVVVPLILVRCANAPPLGGAACPLVCRSSTRSEDLEGRRYMDFHGNSVHQVGFGNAAVVAAIKHQIDELPFCTRRYTNKTAVALAKRLTDLAPDPLNRVYVFIFFVCSVYNAGTLFIARLLFWPRRTAALSSKSACDSVHPLVFFLSSPLVRLFAPGGTACIGMAMKLARCVPDLV